MSLRKAINSMCKECIYDSIGGTGGWKQQVEQCTSKNCPLYLVRPKAALTIALLDIVESSSGNEPKKHQKEHPTE